MASHKLKNFQCSKLKDKGICFKFRIIPTPLTALNVLNTTSFEETVEGDFQGYNSGDFAGVRVTKEFLLAYYNSSCFPIYDENGSTLSSKQLKEKLGL